MATEVVVNMGIDTKQQENKGPSPQERAKEVQKVVQEFADVMSKLLVILTASGRLTEGKDVAEVMKASDVARVAKDSEATDLRKP